jgi:hypothetical protein
VTIGFWNDILRHWVWSNLFHITTLDLKIRYCSSQTIDFSHISCEVVGISKKKWVLLLSLPPRCSQHLKPLNVSVYRSLKARCETGIISLIKSLLLLYFPYASLKRRISSFYFMDPSRHLVGLLGRGISPAPRPQPTQDNTTQRNADTHPCPEQDSNLQS